MESKAGTGRFILNLQSGLSLCHSSNAGPGSACRNSCWSCSSAGPRVVQPLLHPPAWTPHHWMSMQSDAHCSAVPAIAEETATEWLKDPWLKEKRKSKRTANSGIKLAEGPSPWQVTSNVCKLEESRNECYGWGWLEDVGDGELHS